MKRAVYTTPTLDFLKEQVANVPDPVGAEPLPESATQAPAAAASGSKTVKRGASEQDEDKKDSQRDQEADEGASSTKRTKKE